MAKTEEIKTEEIEVCEMNLFEKIQAVSNEVNVIAKNMSVGSGSYSYKAVGDLDVILAIKKAESKFRILSIPIKQDLVNSEILTTVKSNNESKSFIDTIKMTVRVIDLDDTKNFIDVESFGKGVDSGDKGFGKASTYARKYALLNVYKIGTGVDPDENKSEEIQTPKTISEKRQSVENFFNADITKLQNMLKHYNVGEISDLTEKQVDEIYKTYHAKNKM